MNDAHAIPPSDRAIPPLATRGGGTLSLAGRAVSREPRETWLAVLAGFVLAEITAYLVCQLPPPHARSLVRLLSLAIRDVGLTMAAGALGTYLPGMLLRRRSRVPPLLLIRLFSAGWLCFPCIALLRRQYSPWIVLAVGVASIPIARGLTQLAAALAGPTSVAPPAPERAVLPSLAGLPAAESRWRDTFALGLCAQLAIVALVAGSTLLACALIATGIFLAAGRWSTLTTRVRRSRTGRTYVRLAASAVLLTLLAMVLWTSGGGQVHSPLDTVAHKPPPPHGDLVGNTSAGWVGIILLPPPKKKEEIVAPPDQAHSALATGMAKPVVIPFDGPYWYFKAPNRQPGGGAHVAHGRSTEVNVRSSNNAPLLMEAHQQLGRSLSLRCCRAIEIAITNADARPGGVSLGLLLTDSKSPGTSLSLGERPILSSQGSGEISPSRPPIQETLHFAVPATATLLRFDTLSVSFLPDRIRAHGGVKVAIETFTLLPR